MAEEIKQVLGFDASQAISELNKLDQRFKQSQSALRDFTKNLGTFNRKAANSIATMKRLADEAERVHRAFGRGFATISVPTPAGGGQQQQIQAFVNLGKTAKSAQKNIQAVGTAAQNTASQITSGMNNATRSAQGLTISFETMARIVTTQLIVRSIGAIQRELSEAVDAAFEFQNTVAEIATIDPRGGAGFGEISNEVRALSDAFNADLGDVGRGLYQTISNQIARFGSESERAAENYEFLTTAIQLSRAGVATVEQSVNLLAGTINAFGRDSSDAARIAGQFFKVVELGRTTIRELATSFNTVAPLAAELGVSIEELGASFATITIGGVDTAKAATQIRGAMNALLKPTTEMKQAFEALGVSTGEDLIELFGFQGALQAVIGTTDGTSQSVAKLIPRVRGLTGVLRLVKSGSDAYADSLDQIIKTNQDLLKEKFDIVATTNAFEVEQELRKLRNFLIDDFGNSVIRITKYALDFAGGMEEVLKVLRAVGAGLKIVGPALILLAGGFTAVSIQARLASANVGLFGKSLAGLGAVFAAVAVGNLIGQQVNEALNAAKDARESANRAILEDISKRAQAERDIEKANNQLILTGVRSRFAELSKLNSARIREAREAAQAELQANKTAFEVLLSASQNLERQLRSQFESREQQAKDSIKNIQGFEQELRDERFEQRTKDYDDAKKFSALERKLAEDRAIALGQINRQALQAGDPEALEQIREVFDEALSNARELQQAAGDDPRRQQRANQAVIQAIQARIGLERQLIRTIAQRRAAEKAAADEVAKNNAALKETFKDLIESQEGIFETGISDEERNRRFEQFRKSRLEFFELIQKNAQVGAKELADFGRIFGERGFVGLVERDLSRFEIKQLVISDQALVRALKKINDAIQGGVEAIDLEIRVALEGAGIKATSQKEALEQITSIVNADQVIKATESEIQEIQDRTKQLISNLPNITEELAGRVESRALRRVFIGQFEPGQFEQALVALQRALIEAAQDGQVTAGEIANVESATDRAKQVYEEYSALGQRGLNLRFAGDIAALDELRNLYIQLRQETENLRGAQDRLREAEAGTVADPAARQRVIDEAKAMADRQRLTQEAAGQTTQEVDQTGQAGVNAAAQLDNMTTSVVNTRDQVAQLQTDLNNLQAPDVQPALAAKGGLMSRFAKGGLVKYLDRGGFLPRGTDTIPAMLSPGEFVINARSARRFYSELQAINAGVRPVYRQDGGPVSNTQIGDINVSVPQGRNSEATGREIGRSIRRELRRNTTTL